MEKFRNTVIVKGFALPMIRRLGTMLAAALISQGVGEDLAAQVQTGLTAAALIAFDLVGSWLARRAK